jgi:hypothetical protein
MVNARWPAAGRAVECWVIVDVVVVRDGVVVSYGEQRGRCCCGCGGGGRESESGPSALSGSVDKDESRAHGRGKTRSAVPHASSPRSHALAHFQI